MKLNHPAEKQTKLNNKAMAASKESRIKSIQEILTVPQTGIFDLVTCKAYETLKKLNVVSADLTGHKKEIQKSLGFTGKNVDGDIGPDTISKIEKALIITVPPLSAVASNIKKRTLIIGAGHGGSDPGASGNGYIERDLAIECRNILVAELQKMPVKYIVDSDSNALKGSILYFKKYFNADSINIDIYWNAGSAAATGT